MFDPDKWAVWHYRATIANDGSNSGNHGYNFTPGAGNILVVLGGILFNGDTVALNGSVIVRNSDNNDIRRILPTTSIAGGSSREFPTKELSSDDGVASAEGVVVSGDEDLQILLASVNVNDDSLVSLYGLVSGGPPTVTLISPTGATETETENRIV